jgi:hypothetical protein
LLRKVYCLDSKSANQDSFNPANKKAEEIAAKLKRGRERIAAEKGEGEGSMIS